MNTQIRALTGGDITKEKEVLASYGHKILINAIKIQDIF